MKARRVKGLDPGAPLGRNAALIVLTRADELRSLAPEALMPGATRAQHDMRIAAKRLRYVLEVTGFCLGSAAQTARRCARKLQDLLGEMHDCDVMLPRVETQLDAVREADARAVLMQAGEADDLDPGVVAATSDPAAYQDLELLAVHLRARRALLFERFRHLWQAEVSKGTWAKLDRAARQQLKAADEKRGSQSPPTEGRPAPAGTSSQPAGSDR